VIYQTVLLAMTLSEQERSFQLQHPSPASISRKNTAYIAYKTNDNDCLAMKSSYQIHHAPGPTGWHLKALNIFVTQMLTHSRFTVANRLVQTCHWKLRVQMTKLQIFRKMKGIWMTTGQYGLAVWYWYGIVEFNVALDTV